jgi:archaellum biogenesis ATPase FlaH
MSELYIVGVIPVKTILLQLMPYLIIKKPTAKLILLIIDKLDQVKTRSDFIEVCKLVDKIAEYTDSKKRIITAEYVSKYYSAGASNDIIN